MLGLEVFYRSPLAIGLPIITQSLATRISYMMRLYVPEVLHFAIRQMHVQIHRCINSHINGVIIASDIPINRWLSHEELDLIEGALELSLTPVPYLYVQAIMSLPYKKGGCNLPVHSLTQHTHYAANYLLTRNFVRQHFPNLADAITTDEYQVVNENSPKGYCRRLPSDSEVDEKGIEEALRIHTAAEKEDNLAFTKEWIERTSTDEAWQWHVSQSTNPKPSRFLNIRLQQHPSVAFSNDDFLQALKVYVCTFPWEMRCMCIKGKSGSIQLPGSHTVTCPLNSQIRIELHDKVTELLMTALLTLHDPKTHTLVMNPPSSLTDSNHQVDIRITNSDGAVVQVVEVGLADPQVNSVKNYLAMKTGKYKKFHKELLNKGLVFFFIIEKTGIVPDSIIKQLIDMGMQKHVINTLTHSIALTCSKLNGLMFKRTMAEAVDTRCRIYEETQEQQHTPSPTTPSTSEENNASILSTSPASQYQSPLIANTSPSSPLHTNNYPTTPNTEPETVSSNETNSDGPVQASSINSPAKTAPNLIISNTHPSIHESTPTQATKADTASTSLTDYQMQSAEVTDPPPTTPNPHTPSHASSIPRFISTSATHSDNSQIQLTPRKFPAAVDTVTNFKHNLRSRIPRPGNARHSTTSIQSSAEAESAIPASSGVTISNSSPVYNNNTYPRTRSQKQHKPRSDRQVPVTSNQ